jgi:hypothetical protein
VYLLYSDESGNLANPSDTVFVVAGIAVHEDAVRPLAGQVNSTINARIGVYLGKRLEIHGSPMRTGRGDWQRVDRGRRRALAYELLDLICDWRHPGSETTVRTFAVITERGYSESPFETAYGELLHLFDSSLRAGRRRGNPHNGILIADRGKYENRLEDWVQLARSRFRRPTQDARRLHALAETPFFVDSKSTRLMQLADLVAHAFYRAYNAEDWDWASRLLPGFDRPLLSTLLHFTTAGSCACRPCVDAVAATPLVPTPLA